MKTAISIPDDVFADAERLAAESGTSRSQLYTRAVREYVARHSAASVTASLDAVYEPEPDTQAEVAFVRAAASRILGQTEW